MKILYGAGNRVGADIQAARCLESLISQHDIRIAAHVHAFRFLPFVHWNLGALYNKPSASKAVVELFGHTGTPVINVDNGEYLIDDIVLWEPDLIISDAEPITAHVAQTLGISLWYCSPLHLEDGIEWGYGKKPSTLLEPMRKMLLSLPTPKRMLIYSPFCSLDISIKPGYEWVNPYYDLSKDSKANFDLAVIPDIERFKTLKPIFSGLKKEVLYCSPDASNQFKDQIAGCRRVFLTGETSYLTDCLYGHKSIYVMPSNNDPEAQLNAAIVEHYDLGKNLNQTELYEDMAEEKILKALKDNIKSSFLQDKSYPTLGDII